MSTHVGTWPVPGILGRIVAALQDPLRRRELAIRMALGSPRRSLIRLVLRRTCLLVAIGAIAGVALVLALSPVLASVMYLPQAPSAWSWLIVAALISLVSAVACAWPTWRALRVDPVGVLAAE